MIKEQPILSMKNLNDGSLDAFPVSPFARVVPNGLVQRGTKTVLRATILLTPDPLKKTSTDPSPFTLDQWPSQILQSIEKEVTSFVEKDGEKIEQTKQDYTIGVAFARVSTKGECRPVTTAFSKHAQAIGVRKIMSQGGASAPTDLQALWTKTFTAFEDEDVKTKRAWWAKMEMVLSTSMAANSYIAGSKFTGPNPGNLIQGEEAKIEVDGKIKVDLSTNKKHHVDAILVQSHADLAIALEYGRVRKLLGFLKLGKSNDAQSTDDRNNPAASDKFDKHFIKALASIKKPEGKKNFFNNKVIDQRNKERGQAYAKLNKNFLAGCSAFREALNNLDEQKCGPSVTVDPARDRPSAAKMLTDDTVIEQCLEDGKAIQTYSVVPMKGDIRSLDRAKEKVEQAYFAIQSTAALSRLYCLAFDVEIELNASEIEELFGTSTADTVAICISVQDDQQRTLGVVPQTAAPWSFTKLTRTTTGLDASASGSFWPITRDEKFALAKGSIAGGFTRQVDGYIAVGECWKTEDNSYIPRFDLTSLNIRNAIEQETVFKSSMVDKKDLINEDVKKEQAEKKKGVHAKSFQTAGLAIVDRGAQRESAIALARRKHGKLDSPIVPLLHAEELTVGLRMDVGVPGAEASDIARWRPMHLRSVDYGDATKGKYEKIADRLMPFIAGDFNSLTRIVLDASTITSPEQIVPKASDGGTKVDLVTAENLITWEGAPLGVETLRPLKEYEVGSKSTKQFIKAEDVLPFGRKLNLPSGVKANDHTPPRLRFGWPYSFSFRSVFSGGLSVSFGSLNGGDNSTRDKLIFPGLCDDTGLHKPAFFRFLRQKSIDPPVLVMPLKEGLNHHGEMGYQSTTELVIRTVEDTGLKVTRNEPAQTSRVILPPFMAMDEVARHGVLDNQTSDDDGFIPEGAFASFGWFQVRNGSGFRSFESESILGFNGAWVPVERRTKTHLRKPAIIMPSADDKKPSSRRKFDQTTPVFEKDESEKTPYYPDPFAQTLIISARFAGTSKRLGKPYCIDIYTKSQSTGLKPDPRNALPVILTIVRGGHGAASEQVKTEDLVKELRYVTVTEQGLASSVASESNAEARELILELPQGASFDFDIWFAPSVHTLARQSALLQAIAVFGLAQQKPFDIMNDVAVDAACRAGLADFLAAAAALDPCGQPHKKAGPFNERHFTLAAPGGLPVPTEAVLLEVAESLSQFLKNRPLPEICSHTTISCVHASDRTDTTPQLLNPVFHKAKLGDALKAREKLEPGTDGMFPVLPAIVIEDESSTLLDGTLIVDLKLISGFDIIAEAENPSTSVFDNPDRKRDLGAVRSGQWPIIKDANGNPYIKTSSQLFGFNVNKDGTVNLPRGKISLFTVRNLPTDPAQVGKDKAFIVKAGKAHLPLLDLLHNEEYVEKFFGDSTVARQSMFDDCIGRNVTLSIRMIPRSLIHLTTADQLKDGKHVVAEPYPNELIDDVPFKLAGKEVGHLLLPSSQRPAELPSITPGFFFAWHGDDKPLAFGSPVRKDFSENQAIPTDAKIWQILRKPINRISVGRNFFSATSNEKLAVILWPPNLLEQPYLSVDGYKNSKLNVVRLQPALGDPARRDAQLADFEDDDLGLGGQFVTRLGADPVRAERYSGRAFLDRDAFQTDPRLRHRINDTNGQWRNIYAPSHIIEHARLPLTGKTKESITDDKMGSDAIQFMSVALLLYEPRFDPETERWFADIELTNASAFSEPFLRLGVTRCDPEGSAGLAVSYPSTVWTKVLPQRDATVVFSASDKTLSVTVKGPKTDIVLDSKIGGKHAQERVQIYLRLVREKKATGSGDWGLRKSVDQGEWPKKENKTMSQNDALFVQSQRDTEKDWHTMDHKNPGGVDAYWSFDCTLDLATPLDANERLVLCLEEVEHYRPATYQSEPVDPTIFKPSTDGEQDHRDYAVETGPKFSCRVVIKEWDAVEEIPN